MTTTTDTSVLPTTKMCWEWDKKTGTFPKTFKEPFYSERFFRRDATSNVNVISQSDLDQTDKT